MHTHNPHLILKGVNTVDKTKMNARIGIALVGFSAFRDANPVIALRSRTTRSIAARWIYFSLPWMLHAVNFMFVIACGAFVSPPGGPKVFSYMRDVSNSVVLTGLLFLTYYLSGYYAERFEEIIEHHIRPESIAKEQVLEYERQSRYWLCMVVFTLFALGCIAASGFYSTVKSNDNLAYWIVHLNQPGRICYCIILSATWYLSLSFLGMVIFAAYAIYWMLRAKAVEIPEFDPNGFHAVRKITSLLLNSFSYGIFYIGGAVVFIVNDHLTLREFGIKNAFSNNIVSLCTIAIIFALVLFVFVPVEQLYTDLKANKEARMRALDDQILKADDDRRDKLIDERQRLAGGRTLAFSFSNKLVVWASILIPIVGVVLQLIQLFVDMQGGALP